jgi:tetratricopeptide (TPR) repeat protein
MRQKKRNISENLDTELTPNSSENIGKYKNNITILVLFVLLVVAIASLAAYLKLADRWSDDRHAAAPPSFVGSEACVTCHQQEAAAWRGSHHGKAMAHATQATVLGNFNNATFEHFGIKSRFYRQDGKYMVATDGADGSMQAFEIKYVIGLEPLQQYMVEFPDGRVQALSISWDSRPRPNGGQRWFHLYPNEKMSSQDDLHWTKRNQNWNFMCAECHSTGVRKNYNQQNDTFKTSFSEISVGCESCHGQGSRHVSWAKQRKHWLPFNRPDDQSLGLLVRYVERLNASWPIDPATGSAKRSQAPMTVRPEVETCGLCHARRDQLSENWIPGRALSETHNVSLLRSGLFHADGQMLDEVFNYASFKQSKMYAAGVTCSDCHDPHAGKLRFPGNNTCLQCHAGEKFSSPSHQRHAGVSPALTCVSCHMPKRTYMVVDDRHDHGFRVPRPDVSATLGTPNACNDCHKDKPAHWAAAAIEAWHGPHRKGHQTYASAFDAARSSHADAPKMLAEIATNPAVPGIARATAFSELVTHLSPAFQSAVGKGLADDDPMVRLGALDMLDRASAQQIWATVAPMLRDPVLGVRLRAVQLLASVPAAQQPEGDRSAMEAAAREFVTAQRLHADRPENRTLLGNFLARRREHQAAEAEWKAALQLSARFAPASINLADMYRELGRDSEGEAVLRQGLSSSPDNAALHHSLGLALIRLKRPEEALQAFRRAFEIDPGTARHGYVYAVALNSAGRAGESITILEQISERHPNDRETLVALISYTQNTRDFAAALRYAERLSKLEPTRRGLDSLILRLRRQIANP